MVNDSLHPINNGCVSSQLKRAVVAQYWKLRNQSGKHFVAYAPRRRPRRANAYLIIFLIYNIGPLQCGLKDHPNIAGGNTPSSNDVNSHETNTPINNSQLTIHNSQFSSRSVLVFVIVMV